MDYIIKKAIDPDILKNNKEYFFTSLSDRFEPIVERWIQKLEQRYGKAFEPIWILSCEQNRIFKKRNFVVINKTLKQLKIGTKKQDLVYLEDYEDLNKYFAKSTFIQKMFRGLVKKQGRVFVLSFTSSFLDVKIPGVIILGPKPSVAQRFDNKVEHVKLFKRLNLPRNNTKVCKNISELRKNIVFPAFVSASYTSGGSESKIVYNKENLEGFYYGLRKANKNNKLLWAQLITDLKSSPNVSAIIIGKNKTKIICTTDQVLRGNVYLGNIFPTKVNDKIRMKLETITRKVGNDLSMYGFRGLFGIDFIVDSKNKIYTTDLNPRRQGGYLCNVFSSKIDIVDMELRLALGEKIEDFDENKFKANYVWAHSKVKPYFHNVRILKEFKSGEEIRPFERLGALFKCIYYPKSAIMMSGNAGYFITSGNRYDIVKTKLIRETEILISKDFETYEGAYNHDQID